MRYPHKRRPVWVTMVLPIPIKTIVTGTTLVLFAFAAASFVLFTRLAELAGALHAGAIDGPQGTLVHTLGTARILFPAIFVGHALFLLLVERGRRTMLGHQTRIIGEQLGKVGLQAYQARTMRKGDELIPLMAEVDRLADRMSGTAPAGTRHLEVAMAHRERGAAILVAVVAMSSIFLLLLSGLVVVEATAKTISGQLKYQGQAFNVASAGTTDALVWFQKQPTQPVTTFSPQRNTSATPPVNDTEIPTIGIVRTFPLSTLGNVWGRYEVRSANVSDVSVQRGRTGAGTIWQFDSYGMVFVDRNADSQLNWTDANSNGVFDRGEPGEVIALTKVRAEAQRLSLVLPGGNAALQGYTCSSINLTSGAAGNRVLGSSSGIGVSCRNGSGSPSTSGAMVTGSPAVSATVTPYNDAVTSVFGITQAELVTLANVKAPNIGGLPDPLPAMSLTVVQGDATFTTAHPLVGSGILAVFGNLVVPAGSSFNGVIYVTGNYSQSGPSQILGAVVSHGGIALNGGSDITEAGWDGTVVQQVRAALGGYRFSRTEYVVP